MASIISVEKLQGLSSGDNPNTIIVPAGQTLDITNWSPPAGTVLSIQQTHPSSSPFDFNGTSFYTLMAIQVTPKSASSKFLLSANTNIRFYTGAADSAYLAFHRNDNILPNSGVEYYTDTRVDYSSPALEYLDSPNTTSTVTYTFKVKTAAGSTFRLFAETTGNCRGTSFTVMEIAG